MTPVLLVTGHEADAVVRRNVFDLLEAVDDEFVPPLSRRSGTESMSVIDGDLANYFEAMRQEVWLIALDGEEVVGLLSFRPSYGGTALKAWAPSMYATTVAVSPRSRRRGIGTFLYDGLLQLAQDQAVPYLTTRTWTTNSSHLGLLQSRGFHEVSRWPDDREVGVGTVYLGFAVPGVHSEPVVPG